MSNKNFFALLDDDETDEPQAVIARAAAPVVAEKPAASKKAPAKPKSAPLPNAVSKETPTANGTDSRGGRGGRGGRGRGGRGGRGDRDASTFESEEASLGNIENSGREGRGGYRGRSVKGGRGRGFFGDGDDRRFRREFDRQPGTGRGHELKRDGAGRGNWGVQGEVPPEEASTEEKEPQSETIETLPNGAEVSKPEDETPVEEKTPEEKIEEEPKEMTLDEYEKLLEEKRKQLLSDKPEIRKVEVDKDLKSMTIMKKATEEELVFAKLGEEKEKKKRFGDEEKKPKAININEFLRPAEGETYYPRSSRGRGRGRVGYGSRANGSNGSGIYGTNIDTGDQTQFPTLGA